MTAAIAKQTHSQATHACAELRHQTAPKTQRLVQQFERLLPRVTQVIERTVLRVLHGEMMPGRGSW